MKWVSMAEALGWTPEESEGSTYTGNNKLTNQAIRTLDQPAPTVTAGHDSGNRGFIDPDGQFFVADVDQVSALQTYPSVVYRNGNQANAARRSLDQPAPTLLFGHNSNKVEWMSPDLAAIPSASGVRVTVEEASALQSYPTSRGLTKRPSPTITGGGVETGGAEPIAKYDRYTTASDWVGPKERLSVGEVGTLQTYEKPFVWCGSKSKQFLQIGNAVPPLLAERVLAALVGWQEGR